MTDKDKLWFVTYVEFPSFFDSSERAEIMTDIVRSYERFPMTDESVKMLFLERSTEYNKMNYRIECIYDPTHGSNEIYEEFFKKANEYIDKLINKE